MTAGVDGHSSASARWKIAVALALAGAVVLGIAVGQALPRVGSTPASYTCQGEASYRGTIVNRSDQGVGDVAVTLSPAPPFIGNGTTVRTNATGNWSAVVPGGCPYDAHVHWQSANDGPLLNVVDNVRATSTVMVDVSSQLVNLNLVAEYPNADNVTVPVNLTAGLVFSVDAVRSGNISLAFLGLTAADYWGANFTIPNPVRFVARTPLALEYLGAQAYRVQDVNGDWAVYVVPTPGGSLALVNVTESLTVAQGIGLSLLESPNPFGSPFVEDSPGGTTDYPFNFSAASHALMGAGASPFGITVDAYLTAPPGGYARIDVTLVNSGPSNVWFVQYQSLADFHWWYCGAGNSPPFSCL